MTEPGANKIHAHIFSQSRNRTQKKTFSWYARLHANKNHKFTVNGLGQQKYTCTQIGSYAAARTDSVWPWHFPMSSCREWPHSCQVIRPLPFSVAPEHGLRNSAGPNASLTGTHGPGLQVLDQTKVVVQAHEKQTFSSVNNVNGNWMAVVVQTLNIRTFSDGTERAGNAPPCSMAFAGISLASIWPVRTRKFIKSRAAFFSASFLVVELPAPVYGTPGTRTSHKNRCRCFGPLTWLNNYWLLNLCRYLPLSWQSDMWIVSFTSWSRFEQWIFTLFSTPFVEKCLDIGHFVLGVPLFCWNLWKLCGIQCYSDGIIHIYCWFSYMECIKL